MIATPVEVVQKVWGQEEWYVNEEYCFKILRLKPGFQSSLHYHRQKKETFIVRYGACSLEVHKKDRMQLHKLATGDSITLQPGQPHRFWVETQHEECVIYEVSTHHSDDDVVRLEESRRI